MKNIVWLTEWLPSVVEPYAGDGIERRAKAVSLFNNVQIIFVKKKPGIRKVELEERIYNPQCKAMIYYYPSIRQWGSWPDTLLSNYYFFMLHWRALRQYRKTLGKPAGIQVNVTMKNGMVALFYKWTHGIKYIVTEGASLFLPGSKPAFSDKAWLFRFFTRRVLANAAQLVTVSDQLGKMTSRYVFNRPWQVIPSVVDTSIFFPPAEKKAPAVFRFIHISSLDYPKNFEQVLAAVKIVISKGHTMELLVHGPDRPALKQLAIDLGIAAYIVFEKEGKQEMLAESLRKANCLILYSRYETFGNVLIEANACGLPVIVSDYPTFSEIVIDGITGLTAMSNNPAALAEKMIHMQKNYASFDASAIVRLTKEKYGFDIVGKKFDEIYHRLF